MPTPTINAPSVARILHAYCDRWKGPRAAIVSGDRGPGATIADVNVFFQGKTDTQLLHACRARQEGNTFEQVPVFDFGADEVPGRIDFDAIDQERHDGGGEDPLPRFEGFGRIVCVWPPRA